jgi:hypothetical protein
VFPQHGPGRKHERPIRLEPWQELIVAAHPKAMVRGLIPPMATDISTRSQGGFRRELSTTGIRATCSRTLRATS